MGALAATLPAKGSCPPLYRPRNPGTTALYQLVEAHYETLKGLWEERFDPLEFLARALIHIPEPNKHLVHFYGPLL